MLRGEDEATLQNARWAALITTIVTFLLACWAWAHFDPATPAFQFVEQRAWFGAGLTYKLGVDGMSFPFVVLTTFLMPFCILTSWRSITFRVKDFMIAFLVLETLMIGVFCSLDLVLFYLFFEGGLIPMFLIIGIWGHGRKVYAAFKFFLYTLTARCSCCSPSWRCTATPARPTSRCCCTRTFRPRCRPGCGSPSSPRSR